jgi:hypothetical protein
VKLLAAVFVLATAASGCTASTGGIGQVEGQLPVCYGPAPTNLQPRTTIEVLRGARVTTTSTFRTDETHRDYALTLPSGEYRLRLGYNHGVHVDVAVHQDRVTRVDFPDPGCL